MIVIDPCRAILAGIDPDRVISMLEARTRRVVVSTVSRQTLARMEKLVLVEVMASQADKIRRKDSLSHVNFIAHSDMSVGFDL